MYEALVARVRYHIQKANFMGLKEAESTLLLGEAADAIEELVRKEKFHAFLWNTIQPNEMEQYISMYNAGNEKEETK